MMLEEEQRKAIELWKMIGGELLPRLVCIAPLFLHGVQHSYAGINICQVQYINKNGRRKTKWLSEKPLKQKHQLICQRIWRFLPLSIEHRKNSVSPEDQKYCFWMWYQMRDSGGYIESYEAKIATAIDGKVLKIEIVKASPERDDLSQCKIAVPKWPLSKINRCLANNFFPLLWDGPPCAVWHRSDEGRSFYLGAKHTTKNLQVEQLVTFLNGPNGDAASVLLAYSCFSMLKSFFPSYHMLYKDDPYAVVKKRIPEQIAINIQSSQTPYAEKLIAICCGHFKNLESSKIPNVDGISVQKIPPQPKRLDTNSFEAKIVQPASVLWVNREPTAELIQCGEIINIQVLSPVESELDVFLSEFLVYKLAEKASNWTQDQFGERFDTDWTESVPIIEDFLLKGQKRAVLKFEPYSMETETILEELNRFGQERSEPKNPEVELRNIKARVLSQIDSVLKFQTGYERSTISRLIKYRAQINGLYKKCIRKLRKIHKKNMIKYCSLDPAYQKTFKRLMENQSVRIMGQDIVRKIAYLSTSFQAFVDAVKEFKSKRDVLCEIVDMALISTFQKQLGFQKLSGVLEQYILSLLNAGQYARIRGEGSGDDNIRIWYDPKEETFLIPSKGYFNDLKCLLPISDITRDYFEGMLIQENILCNVPRKNQIRRTFEIRVRKGEKARLSVLKIKTASLSNQFSHSADVFLEQMKNDMSPYRS